MSSDLTVIIGIAIILLIGGAIGWWLSYRYYIKNYAEILKTSTELLNVTTDTLNKTLEQIRKEKE
jgi:TM2 domain-containing membrane protein YozV